MILFFCYSTRNYPAWRKRATSSAFFPETGKPFSFSTALSCGIVIFSSTLPDTAALDAAGDFASVRLAGLSGLGPPPAGDLGVLAELDSRAGASRGV